MRVDQVSVTLGLGIVMNRYSWLAMVTQWFHSMANTLRLPQAWQCLATPLGCMIALAIVTLACGVLVERFVLILAALALIVLLIGIAWPRLMVLGLRTSLEFDRERTSEGHAVKAMVSVSNLWPLPVWGLVVDGLSDYGTQASFALPAVRPWSTASYHWSFEASCRGVYPGRELGLTTSFPFGLVTGRRAMQCPTRLLVAPHAFSVKIRVPTGADVPWDRGTRLRSSGGNGDLMGVRPYRIGDTLRRVHWAQTAKHQQLVVCEREAFVRSAVELIVDLSPKTHVGMAPNGSLEWCLRITISICQSIVAEGGHARCRLGDRTFELDGRPREWQSFLDYLAKIPREGISRGEALFTKRHSPCSRIVIASDASDQATPVSGRPGSQILIVVRTVAFGGTNDTDSRNPGRAPLPSPCIVLDAPERVAGQLARGLQMEASQC